jgi:acyl-coenzyme A thioesterase PaaI-like protein
MSFSCSDGRAEHSYKRKLHLSFSSQDVEFIRGHVLRALSSNRAPGFNFAGYFLGFYCRQFKADGVEFSVKSAAHCADANGVVNRAALLFSADTALAASNRVFLSPNVRTATLMLRVEFTGAPARGTLDASGRGNGFSPHTALPESVCAGRIVCNGREVMRMSGGWVSPPAPKGMVLNGLPWEGGRDGADLPLLSKRDLDAAEKDVIRRVERAIRVAQNGDLLGALWNPLVKRTSGGAIGRLPVGMHVGNRVGHVQGGFLLNAALVTAEAAVPEHPITTGASSWFISPGQGKVISARSTVLQSGRNIAVVRTELFAAGRKLVLETVSNHAVRAPSP